MKTILSILAMLPFLTFAQYNSSQTLNYLMWGPEFIISNSMPYDYYQDVRKRDELIRENHVNTVKTVKTKSNGKEKVVSESSYNADGLPIKDVNEYATTELSYNGKLLTDVVRKHKRETLKTHADYDDQGRIVHITKHRNGKLQSEYNYVYYKDHETSLVEHISYGRKQKVFKYVTAYDDLLKKPTKAQYFINGKLKRNWTFSCDDKGEVLPKNVTEISSCSYNARNNDGSYIEYYRTINEGKVYLVENTFSKDSVLTDSKQYYNEKILIFHATYNQRTTISEHFNNRGKRQYKYSSTTDEHGNRISWKGYYRNDKVKYGYDCVFGENDLVEKVQYIDEKSCLNFEYTFF